VVRGRAFGEAIRVDAVTLEAGHLHTLVISSLHGKTGFLSTTATLLDAVEDGTANDEGANDAATGEDGNASAQR
jgi:hypothetical protein